MSAASTEPLGRGLTRPEAQDRINALLPAANRGDRAALAALRAACDADPDAYLHLGNVARHARRKLVDAIAGPNAVVAEAIEVKAGVLRDELRGPDPSPLERLLVERIVTNWLHLHYSEAVYAQRCDGEGLTTAWHDYHQRKITRAERRYLASIKALAQVRRLALPAVQVNLGGRQINVAG